VANREALCRSRTSKNEASGPMGAKAMLADVREQLPQPPIGRRGSRWVRMLTPHYSG
jgi:hypothetical protein